MKPTKIDGQLVYAHPLVIKSVLIQLINESNRLKKLSVNSKIDKHRKSILKYEAGELDASIKLLVTAFPEVLTSKDF